MKNEVSLAELIRYVRAQLHEAAEVRRSRNEPAILRVENVTIELNVVATRTVEGKGGIDLQVLTVGGGKAYERQEVHKITVSLRGKAPDEPQYDDDLEEEE